MFITGESYAGIYVPWFANAVVQQNNYFASVDVPDKINLEGIMVGNGCTNYA